MVAPALAPSPTVAHPTQRVVDCGIDHPSVPQCIVVHEKELIAPADNNKSQCSTSQRYRSCDL